MDAADPVPQRRGRRRPPPLLVVALLTTCWVLLAAVGELVGPRAPDHLLEPGVPLLVVAALFAATHSFVVNVQLHREARSICLSEIAMVVALLHLPARQLLLARLIGVLVSLCVVRHQLSRPRKLLFNVSLVAAECAAASLVYAGCLHAVTGPVAQPLLWAAALAAASVASGAAAAAVGLVIHLLEPDGVRAAALVRLAGTSTLLAVPVCALGVVVAAAWHADRWAVVPLAVCTALLLRAYRAYAELGERHLSLERLYRFSQVVSSGPGVNEVLRSVLTQARELAQAEQARITFLDDGGPALEVVLDGTLALRRGPAAYLPPGDRLLDPVVRQGQPLLLARGSRDPAARAWLARHGLRDSVMVPLHGESGPVAVLAVDDRLGDVRGFGEQEVKLLQTVASQAAAALLNGQLVEQLRYDSLHDPLTRLPNRTMFARDLDDRLAEPGTRPLAVGILDLDAFKDVNDTLGHALGDELLREVATRMRGAVGPDGTVARLGGDEFAVLLSVCSGPAEAERWGGDLLRALDAPVELAGIQVGVSASLGLTCSGGSGSSASLLLKQADIAMYDAKHLGRGVSLHRPGLDSASPSRLALVSQLREAVERGEVEVHIQPKVDAVTGRPVGSEALARWHHPERGAVSPDEFIPLAERSGLIGPLTSLVLERSVAACAQWQPVAPGVGVSVNISTRSLSDDSLLPLVDRALQRFDLTPGLLTLEITESHIMADPAGTLGVLHRLRERGVRLSVDDFGTGYSSLSYLRRLPVNEVKVDRSFVQRMTEQSEDAAIVTSIIQLGGTLGLSVVAEGVEDGPTWAALRTAGCDELQGWIISRPMPAAAMAGWLAAWQAPAAHGLCVVHGGSREFLAK